MAVKSYGAAKIEKTADGVTLYGMTQTGGANDEHNNQIAISFGTPFLGESNDASKP